MNIKITQAEAGERLDKFLAGKLNKFSRSQIQKLVKRGLVTINGGAVSAHYGLKAGDAIEIAEAPGKSTAPAGAKAESKPWNIRVIDQTDEFLVINKPAGLAVHGANGYTLADWLLKKFPALKTVGDLPAGRQESPDRPGVVHRLDKDVSGLMVVAKTPAAYAHLKKQFQDRSVEKQYTALAYGRLAKDQATINFPIRRSADGYKMAALPLTVKGELSAEGRAAETRFTVSKRFINYTLLKIKILTGRTHQIRVHLAAYDRPLVGDDVYGTARTRRQNQKLGLKRVFLVADQLSFTDLSGERKNYKISLPTELKNLLKQIK